MIVHAFMPACVCARTSVRGCVVVRLRVEVCKCVLCNSTSMYLLLFF